MNLRLFFLSLLMLMISSNHLTASVNYITYHKEIIKAEEAFIEGEIQKSLTLYEDIFTKYRPFAKDCFIALQLACMQKDTAKSTMFFEYSFASGITWSMLESSSHIQKIIGTYPQYQNFIYNLYKVERKKYLQSLDFPLRCQYLNLCSKDYAFKNLGQHWGHKEFSDSTYAAVTRENVESLIGLTKRFGFKGDLGVGYKNSEIDETGGRDISLIPIIVPIFLHNSCAFIKLKNELYQAVQNGELHPRWYATFHDWALNELQDVSNDGSRTNFYWRFYRSYCKSEPSTEYYNFWANHRTDKDPDYVDKCREKLGISSKAHDQKKDAFGKANNIIVFFGVFYTSYHGGI